MSASNERFAGAWGNALHVAAVFAVDPIGLGGVLLRSRAGEARDAWLTNLRAFLPAGMPLRRIPNQVGDARLLGGLDLAATLASGRPIAEKGLLAECHGGVAIIAMAERMSGPTAARFASALDWRELLVERDGMSSRQSAAFGVLLLDEGIGPDEAAAPAVTDRVAFHLTLPEVAPQLIDWQGLASEIADASIRLPGVEANDAAIQALTATAFALGVNGSRAPILALKVARAHAALGRRGEVSDEDLRFAAAAVLAPRATQIPQLEADAEIPPAEADNPPETPGNDSSDTQHNSQNETDADEAPDAIQMSDKPIEDVVLDAAKAAIPSGLLAQLTQGGAIKRAQSRGRSGKLQHGANSGRPVGVRPGDPRSAGRLNLLATLRAAAPWQPLRRREQKALPEALPQRDVQRTPPVPPLVHIRREDFRINRYQQRAETITIFAVDASGSAALHRLSEAKGAVELLLADCYVRRDRVAVIAFRGKVAEVLLPPTRSLVRAKRGLASLPGGGGTPLAAGIDAAHDLAIAAQRRGETPLLVFLTDGRANVGRNGQGGRAIAEAEALAAARALRAAGLAALVIDTSPGSAPQAAAIAEAMDATFLMLPQSDSRKLCGAVERVTKDRSRSERRA